jgi:hypothetical protein
MRILVCRVRNDGPEPAVTAQVQIPASSTMPTVTARSDHGCDRNWLSTQPITSVR